jgi:ribokinase
MEPAAGRVIVVGSINIDLVMRLPRLPVPGETVLGGVLARHDGGKGANQAVAAARAGASVHMIGAVGAADGDDSIAALAAEGVDVRHIARCDGPTGHAAVLVDEASGENQIAVAAGANGLLRFDDVNAAFEALKVLATDIVVLSFELPVTPLRLAVDLAQTAGARLVVNPAPAQPEYDGLLPGTITTPNLHELAGLTALTGPDTHAAALALARRTSAPVIVTMGADGALLADDGATEHFAGHQVEAVDTTGAGDTLTGVLAASLAQGYPLRASLRRAVAAAALAVTKAGARAGMPAAAAIDSLLGA